jgi:hypothetical protein
MRRFIAFKARFAEYDEQAASMAENLGLPYDGADIEDGTLYVNPDLVAAVMPTGTPFGSESVLMFLDGGELAVLSSPSEVLDLMEAHVTQKA